MENKLEILIEAIDNATKEIGKVQRQVDQLSQETKKSTRETDKNSQAQVKAWAKVGLAIFGVYNVLRQLGNFFKDSIRLAAVHNAEYVRSFVEFQQSIEKFKQSVGEKLLPILKTTFDYWSKMIDGLNAKNAGLSSGQRQLIDELNDIDRKLRDIDALRVRTGGNAGIKSGNAPDAEEAQYTRLSDARKAIVAQLHEYEESAELEKINVVKQMEEEYLTGAFARAMLSEQEKLNNMKVMWAMYHSEKLNMMMAEQQKETEFITFAIETQKMAHQSLWTLASKSRDIFVTGTTQGLMGIIEGTMTAKEAARQMGMEMVTAIIQFTLQKLVSSAISKAMLAGEVAAATAAGTSVALAWSDAAALVSLATLGTNAIPAAAGITSTVTMTKLLAAIPMAEGGIVNRPTFAMIGEAGPEAVIPLKNNKAIGHNIHIEINYPTIRSTEDIDALTEAISDRLSREADRL